MTQADPKPEASLARGFRDVDTAVVGKLARCLTYMDALPAFQQYKNTMLEMMNPQRGSIIADLGCGLGFDVRRLAALVGPEGRAIGVDASLALISSARSTSEGLPAVEFIQADIQHLPICERLSQFMQGRSDPSTCGTAGRGSRRDFPNAMFRGHGRMRRT